MRGCPRRSRRRQGEAVDVPKAAIHVECSSVVKATMAVKTVRLLIGGFDGEMVVVKSPLDERASEGVDELCPNPTSLRTGCNGDDEQLWPTHVEFPGVAERFKHRGDEGGSFRTGS